MPDETRSAKNERGKGHNTSLKPWENKVCLEEQKVRFSHALEGKWKHLSFSLLAVDSCSLLQLSVCHWHKELLQKWSNQCLLQGCEREGKTLSHGGGRRVGATQRTFGSLSGKRHLKSLWTPCLSTLLCQVCSGHRAPFAWLCEGGQGTTGERFCLGCQHVL